MARALYDKVLEAQALEQVYLKRYNKELTINASQGVWHHLFQFGGDPGAGAYPGAALSKQAIVGGSAPSISGGILAYPDPTDPDKNYLNWAAFRALTANGQGTFWIFDLLAAYQGFDANDNTQQDVTGGAGSGASDIPRGSADNVFLFADVQVQLGATPANLTVTYTNSDLTGAKTSVAALAANALQGRIPHPSYAFPLAAGDKGIASIQSAQLDAAMGAGTFALCLAKLLGIVVCPTLRETAEGNFVTDPPRLKRLLTGAAVSVLYCPEFTPVNSHIEGEIEVTYFNPAAP